MSRNDNSKYQQISKEIILKIESRVFLPGDKIPSENELIANYNISNTTARKILLELEHKGWCTRIKGKGTFVLNRFEDKHLTRILGSFDAMKESFSNNLRKEGFIANNIILEKVILENGISTILNDRNYIMEGPVVKIRRLRYGNDILLKDETKYISLTCCPKINLLGIEESLIKIYEEKYHLVLEEVQRMIGTVVLLPGDPANYFENQDPLAVFTLDGAVFHKNGKIVEIEKSLYRGDKYKFAINTKPQLFQGG